MDDAADPEDVRRARRLGIVVRLVLYPLALGLIALAWQHYHGDPAEADLAPAVRWSGATGQGQPVRGDIGDGLLIFFETHVVERCSDGGVYKQDWAVGREVLVQGGEEVHGREAGRGRAYSGRPVVFDARVSARMGDHPSGTVRAQVRWTADHVTVRCDSGPVTFTLHRSP
jgi:hypothetical protein